MAKYTASKSKTQGRPGWSISFRHPLRRDTKQKPGLKIRRGLGTTSDDEADRLVSEMNVLLEDERWWSLTRKTEATQVFDARVVEAFYDDIEPASLDNRVIRDRAIPLPGREAGYSTTLFVGTTGAGKTSLLRHLIGSDPDDDRFPSTSTAKTTIAETEVVLAEGDYEAVVTFFSEQEVRVAVEECVLNACAAALGKGSDERVADRFLNHSDQRFRMGYTLGNWRKQSAVEASDDDWDFEPSSGQPQAPIEVDEDAVPASEAAENQEALERYVARVRQLVSVVADPLLATLQVDYDTASPEDWDTVLDLLEAEFYASSEFPDFIHDVIDDIQSRLDLVSAGRFERTRSGWPTSWRLKTDSRTDFIRQVRWFSSNYAPSYGRLLTPLVDGIRVRGPLYPKFTATQPRLVLLDGQGLGHTPDSTTSVATSITRRFAEVDVILLVDNAEQPMQASPLAVLSSVGTAGYHNKLAVVFTHFDQVKGDNLPTFQAKRDHVLASVRNGVTSLREIVGGGVANSLAKSLESNSYMLGALQEKSMRLPGGVVKELERFLAQCRTAIEPAELPDVAPRYNLVGLDFAIQAATNKFVDRWSTKLGVRNRAGVQQEHWTRVKALNRRIVIGQDHYNNLQPVADLIRELQTQVSRFLDNPSSWLRQPASEDQAQEALAVVRRLVFATVHDFARKRVMDEQHVSWQRAFDLSGRGSTFERAQQIDTLLHDAAPVPGPAMPPRATAFLNQIRLLVAGAIREAGGELEADV